MHHRMRKNPLNHLIVGIQTNPGVAVLKKIHLWSIIDHILMKQKLKLSNIILTKATHQYVNLYECHPFIAGH